MVERCQSDKATHLRTACTPRLSSLLHTALPIFMHRANVCTELDRTIHVTRSLKLDSHGEGYIDTQPVPHLSAEPFKTSVIGGCGSNIQGRQSNIEATPTRHANTERM